jgi:hypothetical protein
MSKEPQLKQIFNSQGYAVGWEYVTPVTLTPVPITLTPVTLTPVPITLTATTGLSMPLTPVKRKR